jgi:hypothetical protein
MKTSFSRIAFFTLCATALFAQQQQPGGWRRFDDAAQGGPGAAGAQGAPQSAPQNAPQGAYQNGPYGPAPYYAAPQPPPAQITLPAGSWVTLRVNQPLSSDHSHAGDVFTATLVQPLISQGFVIARRGETIGGRVSQAMKAGMVKGTSQLAIELTDITLVDGQHVPVKTELVQHTGPTSVGRDVTAVGTTTAMGAAIGAAADRGFGAGMGAIAGAGASVIGVLVTRGRQTVIFPEDTLTFRTTAPITVSTEGAPQAFLPAIPEDYNPQPTLQRRPAYAVGPRYGYGPYYPYPYYAPYPFYGGGVVVLRGGRRW